MFSVHDVVLSLLQQDGLKQTQNRKYFSGRLFEAYIYKYKAQISRLQYFIFDQHLTLQLDYMQIKLRTTPIQIINKIKYLYETQLYTSKFIRSRKEILSKALKYVAFRLKNVIKIRQKSRNCMNLLGFQQIPTNRATQIRAFVCICT